MAYRELFSGALKDIFYPFDDQFRLVLVREEKHNKKKHNFYETPLQGNRRKQVIH